MATAIQSERREYERSAQIVDLTSPNNNYDLDEKILKEYIGGFDSEGNYLTVKKIARQNNVSEYRVYKIVNKSRVVKRSEMLNQGLKYVVAFQNGYGMDDFTDKEGVLFNEDRAEQIYLRTKERLKRGDNMLNYRLKAITKHGEGELCKKLFQRELSCEKKAEDEIRPLKLNNKYINSPAPPITREYKIQLLEMFDRSIKEMPYHIKKGRTGLKDRLYGFTNVLKESFNFDFNKYRRKLVELTGYFF